MRSSAWSSLAISVCSALALAGPASPHIDATPAFLRVGEVVPVSLAAHNDRKLAMNGFAVTFPDGVSVEVILGAPGWDPADAELLDAGSTVVVWRGGTTAGSEVETFEVYLEATSEPGTVSLETEQRYPDGRVVRSPVTLTVVPGDEEPSDVYVWAVVIGFGALVFAGMGLVARRRRI